MSDAVNADRPAWYRYCHARQQRRQDEVDAVARAAGAEASNPVERVKAEYSATRAAVRAFDTAEPELTYDQWRAAA